MVAIASLVSTLLLRNVQEQIHKNGNQGMSKVAKSTLASKSKFDCSFCFPSLSFQEQCGASIYRQTSTNQLWDLGGLGLLFWDPWDHSGSPAGSLGNTWAHFWVTWRPFGVHFRLLRGRIPHSLETALLALGLVFSS